MSNQPPIQLKDAIKALLKEIGQSIAASQGEQIRFQIGQIELEFQVEIERSGTVEGEIDFVVAKIGGGGEISRSDTHSVKLSLQPTKYNHDTRQWEPPYTGSDEIPG
jgi:Trypsin-co-occurring domain 2